MWACIRLVKPMCRDLTIRTSMPGYRHKHLSHERAGTPLKLCAVPHPIRNTFSRLMWRPHPHVDRASQTTFGSEMSLRIEARMYKGILLDAQGSRILNFFVAYCLYTDRIDFGWPCPDTPPCADMALYTCASRDIPTPQRVYWTFSRSYPPILTTLNPLPSRYLANTLNLVVYAPLLLL